MRDDGNVGRWSRAIEAGRVGALAGVAGGLLAAGCGGAPPTSPSPAPSLTVAAPATPAPPPRCDAWKARAEGPKAVGQGATLALATWGKRHVAFVADVDDRAIHTIDLDARKAIATTPLAGRPSGLAVLPDGRVAVALRHRSRIEMWQPAAPDKPLQPGCRVATPAEPVALALSHDGRRLAVTSGVARRLTLYGAPAFQVLQSVALDRAPRGVTLSRDGKRAFVAHAVGGAASVVDLPERARRAVRLEAHHEFQLKRIDETLRLHGKNAKSSAAWAKAIDAVQQIPELKEPARTSCQSFAVAASGDRVFVPQVFVDPGRSGERTSGYGQEHVHTELPAVAVMDERTGAPLYSSLTMDRTAMFNGRGLGTEASEPCLLPRAAAIDEARGTLLVGCYGIDAVVAYDARSARPVSAELRRWRVGAGPSGVAVDSERKRAVVWAQFDRVVNVIPLDGPALEKRAGDAQRAVVAIELPETPGRGISVAAALGRSLFHATGDTRVARDGRACASCHPDGRDDGLVWATPNGPRRTKTLAGMLVDTAPYAWDGKNDTLRSHVSETFERLRGVGGLRSVELRALVAYIRSLDAAPKAARPKDTPKLARGRAIFESKKADCVRCHSGPAFTDGRAHDVGSKTSADRGAAFNTPSLRGLAARGPWFHDGRYKSLRKLLRDTDGKMGRTKHLSEDDLAALEAYLRSL